MFGMRRQALPRARPALGLLSVSALLAFALFPAFAQAEDSSGIQYSDAPPTVTGKQSRESPASSSRSYDGDGSGQSSTRAGSTGGEGSGDRSRSGDSGGAAAGKGGDGRGGGGAAGKAEEGDGKPASSLGTAPLAADSGGSSPLVPILIALAVLAAISIGAVAMRRRREDSDPGSPVSPEAS